MNKDLIDFTDSILGRYNATPDEWDAFESIKWSMNTTHKISAVFFPQRNEVEATWENIATGKRAGATFPVTPDQGEDIAEVLMPCVYQDAACEQRGVRAELKTKPLRWRTGPVPDDYEGLILCEMKADEDPYFMVAMAEGEIVHCIFPSDKNDVLRWLPLSEILALVEG